MCYGLNCVRGLFGRQVSTLIYDNDEDLRGGFAIF